VSIYVEYELRCDGLPGPYDCEPAIYALSAAEARRLARDDGWLIGSHKGGNDFCERHRPDRKDGGT
jgi:hypothetical protein